jgi:hypothetical protein
VAKFERYLPRHVLLRIGGALVVAAILGTGAVFTLDTSTTTTTTTTTTTLPPQLPQAGWTVVSTSKRGVMVDTKVIDIPRSSFTFHGVATSIAPSGFTVARFRATTTAFHWHVGSIDPPGATDIVTSEAAPSIDWATEGLVGVVGAFNGGFKSIGGAGGIILDGHQLEPMLNGEATIAIDQYGHLSIGQWGTTMPLHHTKVLVYRQNLGILVNHGLIAATALDDDWPVWGSPLNHFPLQPRTGIGIDANGNVIYVATMSNVLPRQLAQALVKAGAVIGMQLDMNPFWPIMGLASSPLHAPSQSFDVTLPGSEHSPQVFETGWERDFFVAMAEPASATCTIASTGWTTPTTTPTNPSSSVVTTSTVGASTFSSPPVPHNVKLLGTDCLPKKKAVKQKK